MKKILITFFLLSLSSTTFAEDDWVTLAPIAQEAAGQLGGNTIYQDSFPGEFSHYDCRAMLLLAEFIAPKIGDLWKHVKTLRVTGFDKDALINQLKTMIEQERANHIEAPAKYRIYCDNGTKFNPAP